jgi:molybdate transport system regulatory protein
MGMSYRRAWLLVETMNQCFKSPLVETATGGEHGGGALVTELGQEVVRRYRAMETKAAASVAREMGDFAALMTAR